MTHPATAARYRAYNLPIISLCLIVGIVWTGLLIAGGHADLWQLVALSIISAAALLVGAAFNTLPDIRGHLSRLDAMSAGAITISALMFVLPEALEDHPVSGLAGIAAGLATGLLIHKIEPRAEGNTLSIALTLHSLGDGVILGTAYILAPALSWGVGLAIFVHKMPVGYAVARRLDKRPGRKLLIIPPALATGIGALALALMPDVAPIPTGLIIGMAAGLFVYIALSFLISSRQAGVLDMTGWLLFILGGIAVVAAV